MLVLTRKMGESIQIGDNVTIRVQEVRGHRVRLCIDAPKEMPIHRQELLKQIMGALSPTK